MPNDEIWSTAGAAVRLPVPALTLPSTLGPLDLRTFCAERAVLYIYPATGVPERDPALDPAPGWDHIPGAPGCTPQSLGFKQAFERFAQQGIGVAGVSTQPLAEQTDFAARHALPFPLICDEGLQLQRAWGLPAFAVGGRTFLKRMVLYISRNQIERVLYPIAAPGESAQAILELLQR
jgi:peroxiredoxin